MPAIKTARELIAYYESMIDNWGLDMLRSRLEELSKKNLQSLFPGGISLENHTEVRVLRRKMQRKITELKDRSKTVPAPNTVISTELMGRALENNQLQLFDDINSVKWIALDGSTKYLTGQQLAEKFITKLNTREAGFIQDAVFNYVRRLMDGEKNVPLILDKDSTGLEVYILRCTFNDFCKTGGIQGKDRLAVKRALEGGLLDQIGFYFKDKDSGEKYYIEKRYISRRTMIKREGPKNVSLPHISADSPTAFELDINAEIFSFINKPKDSRGYLKSIQQLSRKIDDAFTRIKNIVGAMESQGLSPEQITQDAGAVLAERIIEVTKATKRGLERYRQPILYIIRRWSAGKEKRKAAMTIDRDTLVNEGQLRPEVHKTRQKQDMISIFWILFDMKNRGDLADIESVGLADEDLRLVLVPKR